MRFAGLVSFIVFFCVFFFYFFSKIIFLVPLSIGILAALVQFSVPCLVPILSRLTSAASFPQARPGSSQFSFNASPRFRLDLLQASFRTSRRQRFPSVLFPRHRYLASSSSEIYSLHSSPLKSTPPLYRLLLTTLHRHPRNRLRASASSTPFACPIRSSPKNPHSRDNG